MKSTVFILSILTVLATSAADQPTALPSIDNLRTNSVNRVILSPQVMRKLLESYGAQNPVDPGYHEKLAAAIERNREQLAGILARQQQQLAQMKAHDATPVPPSEQAQPSVSEPQQAEPQGPPAPETAAEAPAPLSDAPAAAQDSFHRLLIELQSPSPILFKTHTNAPAAQPQP